jgi:Probable zinc-ribbon domain
MPSISIDCADCGIPFQFGEKDQQFYEVQGFTPPKRCKPCRDVRKAQRSQNDREGGGRQDNRR